MRNRRIELRSQAWKGWMMTTTLIALTFKIKKYFDIERKRKLSVWDEGMYVNFKKKLYKINGSGVFEV